MDKIEELRELISRSEHVLEDVRQDMERESRKLDELMYEKYNNPNRNVFNDLEFEISRHKKIFNDLMDEKQKLERKIRNLEIELQDIKKKHERDEEEKGKSEGDQKVNPEFVPVQLKDGKCILVQENLACAQNEKGQLVIMDSQLAQMRGLDGHFVIEEFYKGKPIEEPKKDDKGLNDILSQFA